MAITDQVQEGDGIQDSNGPDWSDQVLDRPIATAQASGEAETEDVQPTDGRDDTQEAASEAGTQEMSRSLTKAAEAFKAFTDTPDDQKADKLKELGPDFDQSITMADEDLQAAVLKAQSDTEELQATPGYVAVSEAQQGLAQEIEKIQQDPEKAQRFQVFMNAMNQEPRLQERIMQQMAGEFPEYVQAYNNFSTAYQEHGPALEQRLMEINQPVAQALADSYYTRETYRYAIANSGSEDPEVVARTQQLDKEMAFMQLGVMPSEFEAFETQLKEKAQELVPQEGEREATEGNGQGG